MNGIMEFTSVKDLRYGRGPALDAWLLHFMTENNLEHSVDPIKNASPEQMRFMVVLDEDQVFLPCSDEMIGMLLSDTLPAELERHYLEKWSALSRLVREHVPYRSFRKRILLLCRYKYRMVQASPIIIPSRLMKRYVTMFLTQSGQDDPFRERKAECNRRALEAIESGVMDDLLNLCPAGSMGCTSISELRFDLDMLEMERLIVLSTISGIWDGTAHKADYDSLRRRTQAVQTVSTSLRKVFGPARKRGPLKILYLPDTSGGIMFDLLIVRALLRQGHRVVLALKNGFHFTAPVFWDWEHDPALAKLLEGAHFLPEETVSKNTLLSAMRQNQFLVISDGTREELNLARSSVTFARTWKEADLIIAKGRPHYRRLIMSSQQFTRDILCFARSADLGFRMEFKPKPEHVRKFSESDLLGMAEGIIHEMRAARAAGDSVMFYSAIIGSLPGQTKTAIELVTAFVNHLRSRQERTYIINPSEHFEEGLDADDLMYMWEKVQRSGLLDVWRFQTVADIERSFELMGRKVPPIWAGKDSTFSTGCTKEMKIALDVQQRWPEMQIIGPSPEKFFRRQEYGVGKFSDAVLD